MKALLARLGVFAGMLVLAMMTAADWRGLDYWVFSQAIEAPSTPHEDLTLVELPDLDPEDAASTRLRDLLGQTLLALAPRQPARVVIDIQFERRGPSLQPVLSGLDALQAKSIPVYLVIDPDVQAQVLDADVLGHAAVAGVGHSRLRLAGRLGFYEPVLRSHNAGFDKSFESLPMLLAGGTVDRRQLQQVFAMPALGPTPLGIAPAQLGASLREKTVIIASSERECRVHSTGGDRSDDDKLLCRGSAGSHDWSGPELLVWALTDRMAAADRRAVQPVAEGWWILLAALGGALLAVGTQALAFAWAMRRWSPIVLARQLLLLTLAALAATVALLLLAGALLLQLGWLVPPTFALLAVLLALLLGHHHLRQRLADLLTQLEHHTADGLPPADYDVFISYSHAPGNADWVDREIVTPLQALRLADGRALRIFFDRQDIKVGQQWFSRINLSILGSRCFLCVWSDDYMSRPYCRWELQFAYPLAARDDFLFLPVSRLPASALTGRAYAQYLQVRQCIDATSRADFFNEVRDAVLQQLSGRPTPNTAA
jgi:hypothetical protein